MVISLKRKKKAGLKNKWRELIGHLQVRPTNQHQEREEIRRQAK
jgi:hypothetical protein